MIGTKTPFEYEVLPSDRESHLQDSQWYTVRLRNVSDDTLTELEVGLHLVNPKVFQLAVLIIFIAFISDLRKKKGMA